MLSLDQSLNAMTSSAVDRSMGGGCLLQVACLL